MRDSYFRKVFSTVDTKQKNNNKIEDQGKKFVRRKKKITKKNTFCLQV